MAGVRMVVTGGYGFVGSAIVASLKEYCPNSDITIFDKSTTPSRPLITDGVKNVSVDITSLPDLKDAFRQATPDLVIHTAGYVPPLHDRYSRKLDKAVKTVNILGTRHVVDAAREAGCRGLIYTSSCCAVTDDLRGYFANIDERWPVSTKSLSYGESKVEAERIVIAANNDAFATCVLRPAVIFGEGDNQLVPPIYACIAKHETPYRLGTATNLWDTVYVGNVGDAHALAARNLLSTKTAGGEIIFIQNNQPVTFREFSLAVWKEFGHYPPFEFYIPQSLGYLVGILAECWTLLSGTPTTISRGSVLDACAMRYASGEKAKRVLGYHPRVGLEEGLRRSCKELKERLMSGSSPRNKHCE